jgi:hypothetical protein
MLRSHHGMALPRRFVYAQGVSSARARRRIEHEFQRLTAPVRLAPIALRRWRALPQMRRLLERPIIIGGCGRSGTSLLVACLSCHPRLCGLEQETRAFCLDAYAEDPDLSLGFHWHRLWDRMLTQPIPPTAVRLCEKTPKNVVNFPRILKHYGDDVRILHLVRDGRDVVMSRHPLDPTKPWVSPERWVSDVRAGLRVDADSRVLRVKYEDLVGSYLPTMRRICEHIGEAYLSDFEHFPVSARIQTHLGWKGKVGAMTSSNVGKWKRATGDARGSVEALLNTPGAEELLSELGYLDDESISR